MDVENILQSSVAENRHSCTIEEQEVATTHSPAAERENSSNIPEHLRHAL